MIENLEMEHCSNFNTNNTTERMGNYHTGRANIALANTEFYDYLH